MTKHRDERRVVETFFDFVRIASPTRREGAMAAHCSQILRDLGFDVSVDDTAPITGSDTGNIIAVLPGAIDGSIAFSAHMDAVEPCDGIEPIVVMEDFDGVEREVIRSAGDTILSADDKAGIAAIFEGILRVIESGAEHPRIIVLLTVGEEQGLLGATALSGDVLMHAAGLTPLPAGGVPCFVLDAGGRPGTIVSASPAHYEMRASFQGRSSHAGAAPEEGVSAIQMAAAAIESMPLGRVDEVTTSNIGIIAGGSAMNVVAAECELVGECRSHDARRLEEQRGRMEEACHEAAKRFGGTATVGWKLAYPAVRLEEGSEICRRLTRAIESVALPLNMVVTGGGADANVLGSKGADAVTLGIGMASYHTCDEHILVEDLEDTARLVEAIILEYARA